MTTYKFSQEDIEKIRFRFPIEAYNEANNDSTNASAYYVRQAFERAFKKVTGRTFHMQQAPAAKDYGPGLIKAGFRVIKIKNYSELKVGDVVLYLETKRSHWGHISVWNGEIWVSDYRQESIHPDSSFENATPTFYRYHGDSNSATTGNLVIFNILNFLKFLNLFEDIEDYGVTTYKVNQEEIEKIRLLHASEAYNGANYKSIDACAYYVRQAFERAFKKVTGRTFHMQQAPAAADYEPGLLKAGFRIINIDKGSKFKVGDVVIYQVTSTSPWGHIAVWTGEIWVSDYRQRSIHPDSSYINAIPRFYRYHG